MKAEIIQPLPSSKNKERLRFYTIGDHRVSDKALLFNGGPGDYKKQLFAIYCPLGNFCHCLGILWSAGEHEVLDDACDAGLLDSLQVEEDEATEDHARLGNASDPFDLTDVSIVRIPDSVWQSDWKFVYALGRVAGGEPNLETGEDL